MFNGFFWNFQFIIVLEFVIFLLIVYHLLIVYYVLFEMLFLSGFIWFCFKRWRNVKNLSCVELGFIGFLLFLNRPFIMEVWWLSKCGNWEPYLQLWFFSLCWTTGSGQKLEEISVISKSWRDNILGWINVYLGLDQLLKLWREILEKQNLSGSCSFAFFMSG